ncbi:MAG: hypothetical protein KDD25_01050 [Bdellovibrionales bacterium]|nr:hypothetical protein [Bdellovibrionales bacterium]
MRLEFAKSKIKRFGDRRSHERTRDIVYFRASNDGEVFGYSELSPLITWGHPPLDELVELLDSELSHALLDHAIEMAISDLKARERGSSLIRGGQLFLNHQFLMGTQEPIEPWAKSIKIKMGDRLDYEVSLLQSFIQNNSEIKLRIDLNGAFRFAEDFLRWWWKVPFMNQVEFLEDPVLNDYEWEQIRNLAPEIPIAADQMLGRVESPILVIKPSWEKLDRTLKFSDSRTTDLVFTHVFGGDMDQSQTLAEATRVKELGWNILDCGMLHPSSQFEQRDGRIYIPDNVLGFGTQPNVESDSWETL